MPLPIIPVMAIPFTAPRSTSAQEAVVRIELTVAEDDVVFSSVPANRNVAPFVIVGASLTSVTVIDAVADWLLYAAVPPPLPGFAKAGAPFVDASPVVWSHATNVNAAVSPLRLSGM